VADEFPAELDTPLEVRIAETRQALERLQQKIRADCPGEHQYVQHRVGWPPWCDRAASLTTGCTDPSTVRVTDDRRPVTTSRADEARASRRISAGVVAQSIL
jgi:hypothetical protein